MNNSDAKVSKYLPKLLEIRGITDRLLVSFRAKKSEKKSSGETSISKGTWWEITYQKSNGSESFVNKGANWEIGAIPSEENDIDSLISKISHLKELINGEEGIKERDLNAIENHLDKIDKLWRPFLDNSSVWTP
jgi:hypothetical protein